MQVILLKEVRGRGGEGDVIDVSRGFANNYLLRQGYAVKATPGNLKQLEERRKNIEKREEVRVADANALVEKMDGATVRVEVQLGEEGQLFGSVTAPMIADAIKDQLGIEVDRRRIELGKPIKATGSYPVPVNIYRAIKATLNVVVEGDAASRAALTEQEGEAVAETVEEATEEAVEAAEEVVAAEAVADVADEVVAEETAE
ncbi:50S ribosomal protein L9 [Adlercreutzia murintestinalis]|uniref:50S ribosomal protein L9 n=1 Tax=Adlercreutzia murintestinalis TaxID=2941325 RepID=UPI00203B32B1|nr:50S ribosomal protein L9 [Adlercreutzia murintestinalis]